MKHEELFSHRNRKCNCFANPTPTNKECKNCYGKGYATEFVYGVIEFGDFDNRTKVHRTDEVRVKLCVCPRSEDLKKYFTIKKKHRI